MPVFLLSLVFATAAFAQPAGQVVSAPWVLTMDSSLRLIENGAVAVQGSRIVAVGPRAEIERAHPRAQKRHFAGSVILPGLINTHTHAPMSLFRGIADDLNLQDWLEKFIFPAEAKNVTADFCRAGTQLAVLEMMLSGTTTYTDMYYFEEVIAEATKAAGMRGVLGQTIIGFPVPDAKTPQLALERTARFIEAYKSDPLITPAVAPHALYTNSDETLKATRALANKYNVPLIIHLSETRRENDDIIAKRQMSPTRVLDALGLFAGRTLAAHGVWLDAADIAILKERGAGVAHCPSSNMKLASGVAPVTRLLEAGIAVGLGPDGPAGSNNDFNLFEEMDLAAKLQKVTTGDPRALPARQVLEMATVGGARALGRERDLGSLEPGKLADLIAVRLDAPHTQPLYDVPSQLVYAAKASDVQSVMIHGRWTILDRKPQTLDAAAVLAQARAYQARIKASLQK